MKFKARTIATFAILALLFATASARAQEQLILPCNEGNPAGDENFLINLTTAEFGSANVALNLAITHALCGAERTTVFLCNGGVRIAVDRPRVLPRQQELLTDFLSLNGQDISGIDPSGGSADVTVGGTEVIVCTISLIEKNIDPDTLIVADNLLVVRFDPNQTGNLITIPEFIG